MTENAFFVALFLFGYIELACTQSRMQFGGSIGVGGINSATNLQPPPNVRPVGAGGAPNDPNMQAVQDPSRLGMSPFLGPAGEPSTRQGQQQGEARSGDPLPVRPLSEREIILNHMKEQQIAATLPPLCSVPASIQHMKVMPMPIPRGNPPENNARTGMTPPGGGPLLNRMVHVPGVQQTIDMGSMQGGAASGMNMAFMRMRAASVMDMASRDMGSSSRMKTSQNIMTGMRGDMQPIIGHQSNAPSSEGNHPMLPIYVDANGPVKTNMVNLNTILKSKMQYLQNNGRKKTY